MFAISYARISQFVINCVLSNMLPENFLDPSPNPHYVICYKKVYKSATYGKARAQEAIPRFPPCLRRRKRLTRKQSRVCPLCILSDLATPPLITNNLNSPNHVTLSERNLVILCGIVVIDCYCCGAFKFLFSRTEFFRSVFSYFRLCFISAQRGSLRECGFRSRDGLDKFDMVCCWDGRVSKEAY